MEGAEEVVIKNSKHIQCCINCSAMFSSNNVWRLLPCDHQICQKCLIIHSDFVVKCNKCLNRFQYLAEKTGFILGPNKIIRMFDDSDMLINAHSLSEIPIDNMPCKSNNWYTKFACLINSIKSGNATFTSEIIHPNTFMKLFPFKKSAQEQFKLEDKMQCRFELSAQLLDIQLKPKDILVNKFKRGPVQAILKDYVLDFGSNVESIIELLENIILYSSANQTWWNLDYSTKLESSILSYDIKWVSKFNRSNTADQWVPKTLKYNLCCICSLDNPFIICDKFSNIPEKDLKKVATHKCGEINKCFCLSHALSWKIANLNSEMKCILTSEELPKITQKSDESKKLVVQLIQLQYAKEASEIK